MIYVDISQNNELYISTVTYTNLRFYIFLFQSFFVAIGFYTSPYLGLHYQIRVLIPAALVGAIAFCWVDKGVTRTKWQIEEEEDGDDTELHSKL